MWESGKIVSSVCHGAAAFSSAKDRKTGEWIFKGKRISAFSNEEEKLKWGGEATEIPFLLENRMKELGGKYESTTPFGVSSTHFISRCGRNFNRFLKEICVVDGRLITGQNPQSSTVVGEALLKQLQN
jgi:putative intracellular protease/amidase